MTDSLTVYHNPRCSKSRQALALLEESGIPTQVVQYIDTPPDAETLRALLAQLGITARALLRTGEAIYRELNLAESTLDESQLIAAMVTHPILIERPIVVYKGKALIGRPPELVLTLL